MNKLKLLITVLMSIMLVFAVTACSAASGPEHNEDTQTEGGTASEYDIAANLKLMGDPNAEKTIDTDHFTLTLPLGDTWDYDYDSKTSITIYNVASKEANCGGRLVSIIAYDAGDKDYENLPSYGVIGEKNGKIYIAEYPSDVQFDVENEQTTADYQTVYEEVNKIRDGSEDSPITLK